MRPVSPMRRGPAGAPLSPGSPATAYRRTNAYAEARGSQVQYPQSPMGSPRGGARSFVMEDAFTPARGAGGAAPSQGFLPADRVRPAKAAGGAPDGIFWTPPLHDDLGLDDGWGSTPDAAAPAPGWYSQLAGAEGGASFSTAIGTAEVPQGPGW